MLNLIYHIRSTIMIYSLKLAQKILSKKVKVVSKLGSEKERQTTNGKHGSAMEQLQQDNKTLGVPHTITMFLCCVPVIETPPYLIPGSKMQRRLPLHAAAVFLEDLGERGETRQQSSTPAPCTVSTVDINY